MKRIISLMLILFTINLFGAEQITLDEALEIAYEKNYDYQNAKIDKENTDLEVKAGYKSAIPNIDYRGGYKLMGNDSQTMLRNGNMSDQVFNHELGLNQPIYDGGKISAGIKIAKKSQNLMKYQLFDTKSQLKLQVIDAYLKALAQKEVVKVYEFSYKDVKIEEIQAKRKYELKLISRADYLPLKVKVLATNTDLIEAQNKYKLTLVELKNILGLPMESDIDLVGLEFKKYNLNLIDIDEDIKYAILNNHKSRIIQLNTEITKEKEKLSRAEFLPQIDARLAYTADDRHLQDSMDKWYWTAGVGIQWKLFDFGKSWDTYAVSKNETKKALNEEKKNIDKIKVEIKTNYIKLTTLNSMYKSRKAELEVSEENYQLQKKKYNQGLISIVDYLTYESTLNNTKLDYIKTKLDYYYAYEKYLEDLK